MLKIQHVKQCPNRNAILVALTLVMRQNVETDSLTSTKHADIEAL